MEKSGAFPHDNDVETTTSSHGSSSGSNHRPGDQHSSQTSLPANVEKIEEPIPEANITITTSSIRSDLRSLGGEGGRGGIEGTIKAFPDPHSSSSNSALDATVEFSSGGGITSDRYGNTLHSANQREFSPDPLQQHNGSEALGSGTILTSTAQPEVAVRLGESESGDGGGHTMHNQRHVAKRLELTSMLLGVPRRQRRHQHNQHKKKPCTPMRHEGYKHYERLLTLTPESPLSDLSSPSPHATRPGAASIIGYDGVRIQLEGMCVDVDDDDGENDVDGKGIEGEGEVEDSVELRSKRFSGTNEDGTEGEESDQNYCSLSATRVYRSVSGEVAMQHTPDMKVKRGASSETQRPLFHSPSFPTNFTSTTVPPSFTADSPSKTNNMNDMNELRVDSDATPKRNHPSVAAPSHQAGITSHDRTSNKSNETKTSITSLQQRMMRSWGGIANRGTSTFPPVLTEEKLRSQLNTAALKGEKLPQGTHTSAASVAAQEGKEGSGYDENSQMKGSVMNTSADPNPSSSKTLLSCVLSPLSLSSLHSPPDRSLHSGTKPLHTGFSLPRIYSDSVHSTVVGETLQAVVGGGARSIGTDAQQSISSLSCSSIRPSTNSPSELGALESPMALNSIALYPSPTSSASIRKLNRDEARRKISPPTQSLPASTATMESPSRYRTPPRTRGDAEDGASAGSSPAPKMDGSRSPASVLSWNANRRSHSPPSTPQKLEYRRPASRQLTPRVPLHPTLPTSKLALSSTALSQLTPPHMSHQRHHHHHHHHLHSRELSLQEESVHSLPCSSRANSAAVSPTAAGRSRELTPASAFLQRIQTPPYSLVCPSEDTTAATFSVSPQGSSEESRSHSLSCKTEDLLSRITPEKKKQLPFSPSSIHTSKRKHGQSNTSLIETASQESSRKGNVSRNNISNNNNSSSSSSTRAADKVTRRLSLSIATAGIHGQKNDLSGSMDAALLSFQHCQEPPRLSLLTSYSTRSNVSSARRVSGGRDLSIGSVRSSVVDTSQAALTAAAYSHHPSPFLPSYTLLETHSNQIAQHPLVGENSSSSMFLARPSYAHHIRQEDEVDFLLPNRNPFSLYRGWAGLLSVSRMNPTSRQKQSRSGGQSNIGKDGTSTTSTPATTAAADVLAASTQSRGSCAPTNSTSNGTTSASMQEAVRSFGEFAIQPHAAAVVFHHTYPTTESEFVDAIEAAQLSVRAHASSAKEKPHKERPQKKTQSSHGAASPTDEEGINDVSDISRRTTPGSPIIEGTSHMYARRGTAAFPIAPDVEESESIEGITSPSAFRRAAVLKFSKSGLGGNTDGSTNFGMPSIMGARFPSDPISSADIDIGMSYKKSGDMICLDSTDCSGASAEQHSMEEHNRTWPQIENRQRLSANRPTLLHPSLKAISSTSAGSSGFGYSSPKRQLVSISLMNSQEEKDHHDMYNKNKNNNNKESSATTSAGTTDPTTTTKEEDSWCERARRGASHTGAMNENAQQSVVAEIGKDASDPPTGWNTATPSPTSMNLNNDLQRSTPFLFRSPGAETKSYTSDHCVSPFSPDSVVDRLRSPIEMRNILFTPPACLKPQSAGRTSAVVPLQLPLIAQISEDTHEGAEEEDEAAMGHGEARPTDFANGSMASTYGLMNSTPGRGLRGARHPALQSSAVSSISRPLSGDLADVFSDRDISPTNRPATTVWVESDRLYFGNAMTPIGQHSTEFPQLSSSSRKFFGSSLRSHVTAPGSPQLDYDIASNTEEQNQQQPNASSRDQANTPERPTSTAEDAARIIQKAMLHLSPKRSTTSSDSTWINSSPNSKFVSSKVHTDAKAVAHDSGVVSAETVGMADGSPIERAEGEEGGCMTEEQPADRNSVFTPIKLQNSSKQKKSNAVQDTPKKVETPAPPYRGVELQRIRSVNHHWESNMDTISVSSTATSTTAGRRGMRMTSALAQLRTGPEVHGSASNRPTALRESTPLRSLLRTDDQLGKDYSDRMGSSTAAERDHVARSSSKGRVSRDDGGEDGTRQSPGKLKSKKSSEWQTSSVSSPVERQRGEERAKEEMHHLSSPPLTKWGVPLRMSNSFSRADQSAMSHVPGVHDDPNASSGRWYDCTQSENDTFLVEHLDNTGFTSDRRPFMDDTVDYEDDDDEDINPLNRFRHHHRYQFLHRLPWRMLSQNHNRHQQRRQSDCQSDERQRSTYTSSKEENGATSPGGGASRSGSGTSDQRSSLGLERMKPTRRGSSDADCASHVTDGGSSMQSLLDSPSMMHLRIDSGAGNNTKLGSGPCRNVHLGKKTGKIEKGTEKPEAPSVGFIPLTVDRNGIVWLVTSRADGMPYAVKEVDLSDTLRTNPTLTATSLLQDELTCYLIATSPDASPYARNNLARYYTVTRHEMSDVYMIQSEYFAHGSVMEWVLKRCDPHVNIPSISSLSSSSSVCCLGAQDVTPQQWLLIVQHGLLALRELHQRNLVHGNPLPFNMFVATPHQFKLGNFGSAAHFPAAYPNVTPSAFLPFHLTARSSNAAPLSSVETGKVDARSFQSQWTPYQIDLHVFAAGMLHLLHRHLSSCTVLAQNRKSAVDMHGASSSFSSIATGSINSTSTGSTGGCSERCFYDKQHVLGAVNAFISSTIPPPPPPPSTQQSSSLPWSYSAVFDILHAGTEGGCTIASLLERIDGLNTEACDQMSSSVSSIPLSASVEGKSTPVPEDPHVEAKRIPKTQKSEARPAYSLSAFSLTSHAEEELRLSVDLEISTLLQQNAIMKQRLESMKRAAQSRQQQQLQRHQRAREDGRGQNPIDRNTAKSTTEEEGKGLESNTNPAEHTGNTQTTETAVPSPIPSTSPSAMPSTSTAHLQEESRSRKGAEMEENTIGKSDDYHVDGVEENLMAHDDDDDIDGDGDRSGHPFDAIRANARGTVDRVRPEGTPPLVPGNYRVGGTPLTSKLWHPGCSTPYSPSEMLRDSTSQLQGLDSPMGSQRSSSIPFSPLPADMLPCSTATLANMSQPPLFKSPSKAPPSGMGSHARSSYVQRMAEKSPAAHVHGERCDVQELGSPEHRAASEQQQQQLQRTPKFSFIPVAHSSPFISPARRSSSSAAQVSLPATPILTHIASRAVPRSTGTPSVTPGGGAKSEGTPLSSAALRTSFSTPLRSTGPRNSSLRNSPAASRLSLFSETRPKIDHHQPISAGRNHSFSTPRSSIEGPSSSGQGVPTVGITLEEGEGIHTKAEPHPSVSPVIGAKESPHPMSSKRVASSYDSATGGTAVNKTPREVSRCLIADDYSDDSCSNSGNSHEAMPSMKSVGERPIEARRNTYSGSDTYASRVNSVLMGSLESGRGSRGLKPSELGRHSSCPVAFGGGQTMDELHANEGKSHRPVLSLGSEFGWNTDLHSANASAQNYALSTPRSVDALFAHNTNNNNNNTNNASANYFHSSMLSGVRSESIFTQTADRSMSRQYLQSLKALSYKRQEEKISRNRLMEILAERDLSDPDDAMLWIVREINSMMRQEAPVHIPIAQATESIVKPTHESPRIPVEGSDVQEEAVQEGTKERISNEGDNDTKSGSTSYDKRIRSPFGIPVNSSTYPLTSKEL